MIRAAATLAALVLIAGAAPGQAANPCYDVGRMAQHVQDSGLAWERRGEDLWRVDMESGTRRFVRVVASCGTNVVIVFAVLADAKDLKPSEALYLYLLRNASRFDHVKIGIDPDGDYLARIDLRSRTFDAKDLEAAARQIRAVVDDLTPGLRAHAN